MLPGEAFQDVSSPPKEAAREPLIKHIRGAKQLSLHHTVATARPIAQILPSGVSREQPNQAPKYPRLQTSAISSSVVVINEDLLIEILLKLPPKSPLGFQTVCKEWLSIISSPAFRRLHTRRYPTTVSPLASPEALFVFQRRWKKPPALQLNFISISEDYVNPMDWDTGYYTEQNLISIYSSETGTWRDIDETFDVDCSGLRTYFENGVLWNGDLHWISDWKYTFCLDLDKEVLNWNCPSLPVPFGEGEFWEFWYFGVCGESLCVIEVNNRSALLFDVFETIWDYSQWVFKYRIDLAPLTTLYPMLVRPNDEGECRFSISCLYEDEVEKIGRLVISMQGKVILYNVKDITVKELSNVGKQDLSCWKDELIQWQHICQHKETFAFV